MVRLITTSAGLLRAVRPKQILRSPQPSPGHLAVYQQRYLCGKRPSSTERRSLLICGQGLAGASGPRVRHVVGEVPDDLARSGCIDDLTVACVERDVTDVGRPGVTGWGLLRETGLPAPYWLREVRGRLTPTDFQAA